MKKITIGILVLIAMCACRKYSADYRGLPPKEFNLAYEETYGRYYDSIPYDVVALDLYSEGLELDSAHRMRGTGYNLYLSDIFVSATTLEAGTYHSDTSARPFTFLPGRDFEGTPYGIYLLYVEDDKLQSIQLIDSGYVEVRDTTNSLTDLQFTLYYKNSYGSRATYKTHFQGSLIPWAKH